MVVVVEVLVERVVKPMEQAVPLALVERVAKPMERAELEAALVPVDKHTALVAPQVALVVPAHLEVVVVQVPAVKMA